ncbi:MAG: amidohydrolase family protein [Acidimicrobiia bacterium]
MTAPPGPLGLDIRLPGGHQQTLHVSNGRFGSPSSDALLHLDLTSFYATGGLGDAHVHFASATIDEFVTQPDVVDIGSVASRANKALQTGMTSAIDKGDKDGSVLALLEQPLDARPDLEMAGPIHRPAGGYYPDVGLETTGPELVARSSEPTRAAWFKIIGDWPRRGEGPQSNYSEEELAAAVAAAHQAGRRVAIHTMAREAPSAAVRAGVDSIEHGLFLSEDDLTMLGNRSGIWVPTLVAMEKVVELLGAESSGGRLIQEGLENARTLLPTAANLGVQVLAGTDLSGTGHSVAMEAVRLSQYGLNTQAALAAATTSVHVAIGKPRWPAVGSPADLVCFDGDPLEDLTALERPIFVMRAGDVVARA